MKTRSPVVAASLLLGPAWLLGGAPAFAQSTPPEVPPAAAQDAGQEPTTPPPARQGGGAPPSDDAFRMGSPPALPEGMTEEEMWPAASAEGWRKPCLVHWQRSFDDAMRVAHAENRPILVAVNMDGEIASEHFAGVRYRDPETASRLDRYACVIASVYRHTPRDYDEEGHRVPCPRFGTVTCGEHIQAERELYEKYFDGKRVSPRHLVLDLEGVETYDVYYSWDTASVVTTFVKGVEGWPEPSELLEPTLLDLAQSADVDDRERIEQAYVEGNRETRRAILESLITKRVVDQVEVLRTAIFGFDLELARLSRRALAQCETEGALDLMAEALKSPLEPADRELLIGAVERLARTSPRARTLASVYSGLSLSSPRIDAESPQLLALEYEASSRRAVDVEARAEDARARPREPGALLSLAEGLLARAEETHDARYRKLMLEDARSAAREAEELGEAGARIDSVVAVVADGLGDVETARARAVAAVEGGLLSLQGDAAAGGDEPGQALSGVAIARLLQRFAEARQRAVRAAYHAGEEWPPEWLSEVNAACTTLMDGPLADETPLVDYYDFLRWLGATPRANAVLEQALQRFPDSPVLHERLRGRLLWEAGPEALERDYSQRLASEEPGEGGATQLTWFAGYASLVAAEHHRRRGEFEEALAAYDRAIGYYEQNAELFSEGADTCSHFIALARAARARVDLELGQLDAATDELIACLEQRPASAATPDGLNITPVATAKMLKARLLEAGDAQRAAQVQAALDALDPKLLEPPPAEQMGAGRRGRRRGR